MSVRIGAKVPNSGPLVARLGIGEMASTLEQNSSHLLEEIEAALGRIDDGTFGTCQRCGNAISEERLEALPWATLCIDCKRKQERG